MTIKEANNFYSQDTKSYNVNNNIAFLVWYNNQIKEGYEPYLQLDEIQELINKTITWYEMKIPNRQLELDDGISDQRFEDILEISDSFTIEQLKYRLTDKEIEILECNYRTNSGGNEIIGGHYNEDGVLCDPEFQSYICVNIVNYLEEYDFKKNITIRAKENGIIINTYIFDSLKKYIGKVIPNTLNELEKELKISNDSQLDISNLTECIDRNEIDKELRDKILNMSLIGLLYSNNTIPEYGYIRAKKMIEEFNEYYEVNINSEEIDAIMNRNYNFSNKNNQDFKKINSNDKGIKKLIKIVLNKNR